MINRYKGAELLGAGKMLAKAATGAYVNCTTAGDVMLVLSNGSRLPVAVAVGSNIVDFAEVLGFVASGTTATATVYALFE